MRRKSQKNNEKVMTRKAKGGILSLSLKKMVRSIKYDYIKNMYIEIY